MKAFLYALLACSPSFLSMDMSLASSAEGDEIYAIQTKRQLNSADVPQSFESSAREQEGINDSYVVASTDQSIESMDEVLTNSPIERPIRAQKKRSRRK